MGKFSGQVFVLEAHGEKKRVLEDIIKSEGGITTTYGKVPSLLDNDHKV